MENTRSHDLLTSQLASYPDVHGNRTNLLLHALTVPVFMAGTVCLALGWRSPWLMVLGPAAMLAAMAAQGRGHSRELQRARPFAGPLDVVVRILVEQWITFPRFVASGGFTRAWRASRSVPN